MRFRSDQESVPFIVIGGRVSEGLDFLEREMELAVGRLIHFKKDRRMATFLDNRVSTSLGMDAKPAGNPAAGIAAFFGRDGKKFDAF